MLFRIMIELETTATARRATMAQGEFSFHGNPVEGLGVSL